MLTKSASAPGAPAQSRLGVVGLLWWRYRAMHNNLDATWQTNRFKILVVAVLGTLFWVGLFGLFIVGFHFIDFQLIQMGAEELQGDLLQFVFSMFFLALFLMLIFSNVIISFGSLSKSPETSFLMAMPLSRDRVYVYKLLEAMLFSSWAFLALGVPLMLSYALVHSENVHAAFYPLLALYLAPFVVLPAAIGGILALLLMNFFPRVTGKLWSVAIGLGVLGTLVAVARMLGAQKSLNAEDQFELTRMLRGLEFAQSPYLPSTWISRGLLATAKADWYDAGLYLLALAVTALFFLALAAWLASRLYPGAFDRTLSTFRRPLHRRGGLIDAFMRASRLNTRPVAVLIAKDIKTFLRDPVQWAQVLIFFGLLVLYIVNLRRFPYDLSQPFYKNLISFLNLTATCMTLATLATRFVFPLLSLEGQKFWILGLMPLRRSRLLLGKFLFAFSGSLAITIVLVVLSNAVMRTGAATDDQLLLLHLLAAGLICFGLTGLAVGMGALFPVFGESDPSKIVSSFGGTLTLVLAVSYVLITVSVLALPCHWHFVTHTVDAHWIVGGIIAATVLSALTGCVPMILGARAFDRMEF